MVKERAPLFSVETIGRVSRWFDEKVVDGLVNKRLIGFFGRVSNKVRKNLHAGHLRNYTFFILIGLVILAIMALWLRR